jgi:hypothetical protein
MAEPMLIEDFDEGASTRWSYTSDRVMGGVSDGGANLSSADGISFAQLRGTVSTANNGGFIQIRQALAQPLPEDATGITLRVRGNGARYYIHMRPAASRRPWQFYQAGFDSTQNWQEITLPWSAFQQQGGLSDSFAPTDIRSIGIVAYGADYEAALDIDWIGTAD